MQVEDKIEGQVQACLQQIINSRKGRRLCAELKYWQISLLGQKKHLEVLQCSMNQLLALE